MQNSLFLVAFPLIRFTLSMIFCIGCRVVRPSLTRIVSDMFPLFSVSIWVDSRTTPRPSCRIYVSGIQTCTFSSCFRQGLLWVWALYYLLSIVLETLAPLSICWAGPRFSVCLLPQQLGPGALIMSCMLTLGKELFHCSFLFLLVKGQSWSKAQSFSDDLICICPWVLVYLSAQRNKSAETFLKLKPNFIDC